MEQAEMVALIRRGVPEGAGVWAEFGAGSGNFTAALRTLLPPGSAIYAVDRDASAVRRLQALAEQPGVPVSAFQADFTRPLVLPPLDGMLLANALHFVRAQVPVLAALGALLHSGGMLLLVEYDLAMPRPWVPFPIAAAGFPALAQAAGFVDPAIIATRRSPSSGVTMFAASARRM